MRTVKVGIVGGGLMGRETASALARWMHLLDHPVRPELVGVADPSPAARDWFESHGIRTFASVSELLGTDAEVIYAAVPHHLHEFVYLEILASNRSLLAEKPFGIDLAAAESITRAIGTNFVRVSSEFPFFPAVQRIVDWHRAGAFGQVLEVTSEFNHASDLDPSKPINWKRRVATCGEYGCLGDLGLHVCHVPFRLGYAPENVFARLQKVFSERPDGKGGMAPCETWDNGLLSTTVGEIPVNFATRRISPGSTNQWLIRITGTELSAEFSTQQPKTLRYLPFQTGNPQAWREESLGQGSVWPTITGSIFEFGFSDAILQMWAAFLAEYVGETVAFGCVTPEEALASHRLFTAALASQATGMVQPVG